MVGFPVVRSPSPFAEAKLFDTFPPGIGRKWLAWNNPFSHSRGCHGHAFGFRISYRPANGFIPIVVRHIKRAPMNRDHETAIQGDLGVNCLFRRHVNFLPVRVIRTDFHYGEIKRAIASANLGKMRGKYRLFSVSGVIYPSTLRGGPPYRPDPGGAPPFAQFPPLI